MNLLKHLARIAAPVLFLATAVGCPSPGGGPIVNPDDNIGTCADSEQCPTGHICSGGACVLGTCDVLLEAQCDGGLDSAYCCKPWEECNPVSFTCVNDPDVKGIGCAPDDENCTPCQVQDDCGAGQFCSGATCFDAAGRTACTSSFQCAGGERCDPNVFLCVPDRGGCTFCGEDFPELCCETGQICSEQTGFCQEVPEAECTAATQADDCNPGLQCDDLGRCVQCVADADCGPGLACDEGAGNCFSVASQCESDADCLGAKRCALDRAECVVPVCEEDDDCEDSRERCDLGSFQCFLPPAQCTEDDEENDSAADATEMENGASYGGVLCRGDADFLSFPVQPNKRYTATVDFGGSGQPGISVVMLDTNEVVESSATFQANQAFVQVAGVTGPDESGTFYVRVTGSNVDDDQWSYSVTIREDEPSQPADCTEDGQPEEPNDDFIEATALTPGQTRTFSRCGTGDVDFYKVAVSPLNGVNVIIGGFFNAEGNINVELFKDDVATARVDQGNGINDVEVVDGPEGPVEYFLKVQLGNTAGAVTDQTYTVTVNEVPRPAACSPDPTEDDGSVATAAQLTLVANPQTGDPEVLVENVIRCNPQDQDLFRFSMPPNRSGNVRINFTHSQGDMALDLLDAAGNQIATSNASNATTGAEQVEVPGSPTDTIEYIARARLAGSTGGTIGQIYSIEVSTFDDSQCISSEPSGGDGVFADGRCIGTAADYPNTPFACDAFIAEPLAPDCDGAPVGTPGCGLTCGNADSDFYRAGLLKNDQTLHAVLTYDRLEGSLDLVRHSITPPGTTVTSTTVTDSDNDGVIEFFFVETSETGKEFAVSVKPKGTTGHQLQPYSLTVEVGEECNEDANDTGAAANEKPSTATVVSRSALPTDLQGSRCNTDVDVYEVIALAGETFTLELDQTDASPNGLQAQLYERTDIPDLNILPLAANVATQASAVADAGAPAVQHAVASDQVLYIVVRPPTGVNVTGPYTLRLSKTP